MVATPRKLTSAHLRVYKPIDALQHNPSRQAVETPTTQPTKANPREKDSVPADCLGGRFVDQTLVEKGCGAGAQVARGAQEKEKQ